MTCRRCGSPTPARICRQCDRDRRAAERLAADRTPTGRLDGHEQVLHACCLDCGWERVDPLTPGRDAVSRHERCHDHDVRTATLDGPAAVVDAGAGDDRLVTDGGEAEWVLDCLDCDFRETVTAPRDDGGPPREVEKRVTTHKHAQDSSHVVRVHQRREQSRDVDPSLLTDGGDVIHRDREIRPGPGENEGLSDGLAAALNDLELPPVPERLTRRLLRHVEETDVPEGRSARSTVAGAVWLVMIEAGFTDRPRQSELAHETAVSRRTVRLSAERIRDAVPVQEVLD